MGALTAYTDLFLRRVNMGIIDRKKKKYIGISSKDPMNQTLLKMYEKFIPTIRIPRSMFKFLTIFYILTWGKSILEIFNFYESLVCENTNHYEFNCTDPILKFTKEQEKQGEKLLRDMKVNKWFICFHARDPVFLAERGHGDGRSWSFRDCDINKFLKASEYITKKGGYALRVGFPVEKALSKSANKKIIDYSSNFRTELGDIYLPAKCKFFLGSSAGLYLMATIFNVPVAHTNVLPAKYLPMREDDLFIPKQLWSKKKKRLLTFRERVDLGIVHFSSLEEYEKMGIEILENTPEEIFDLAKEMNERLDGKWKTTFEDEELQRKYRKIFNTIPIFYGVPSRVGTIFLRKNKKLLE